jgi:hypothetical protein
VEDLLLYTVELITDLLLPQEMPHLHGRPQRLEHFMFPGTPILAVELQPTAVQLQLLVQTVPAVVVVDLVVVLA